MDPEALVRGDLADRAEALRDREGASRLGLTAGELGRLEDRDARAERESNRGEPATHEIGHPRCGISPVRELDWGNDHYVIESRECDDALLDRVKVECERLQQRDPIAGFSTRA